MNADLLRLAARMAVMGSLLAMSALKSSASSISLNRDTGEAELLEKAASSTLDTESVLPDLASGCLRAIKRLRYL